MSEKLEGMALKAFFSWQVSGTKHHEIGTCYLRDSEIEVEYLGYIAEHCKEGIAGSEFDEKHGRVALANTTVG